MIKGILVVVWLLIIANLVIALPSDLVLPLKVLGILMVVAHIAEFFIFRDKIRAKGDGGLKSFAMTFLFGVAYIKGL